MSVNYRQVLPMSQREKYFSNENVDFTITIDNEKLVPGSVVIEGRVTVFSNMPTASVPLANEEIYYDPLSGFHGLFRDFTTEFTNVGVIETFQNYPRQVKMQTVATEYDDSLPAESRLSVEGRCSNIRHTKAYLNGTNKAVDGSPLAANASIPFSIKPMICINKASSPLSNTATGLIKIRARLAPDNEFLFGEAFTPDFGYQITDLQLRYRTVPDDGKLVPCQMEIYHVYRASLESNNQNISTFVPSLCSSVHLSFIPQQEEGVAKKNYLRCAVPRGKAPFGASSEDLLNEYGLERVIYSVNDVDSAIVGYTMQSRTEICTNGLLSFNKPAVKYSELIRHFREPNGDRYIAGLNFGGLIDFSSSKFSCELQSQSQGQTMIVYVFFRCSATMQA
jgi:hypothetical protein